MLKKLCSFPEFSLPCKQTDGAGIATLPSSWVEEVLKVPEAVKVPEVLKVPKVLKDPEIQKVQEVLWKELSFQKLTLCAMCM